MKFTAGQRIVLMPNIDEGWPREDAVIEVPPHQVEGQTFIVRVYPESIEDDGLREVTEDQVDELATRQLALAIKIRDMLAARDRGELKRSANDFISGLIQAYAIVTGIEGVGEAHEHAMKTAFGK